MARPSSSPRNVSSDGSVRQRFGQRIRALREARGWSQEHLAGEASIHVTYLSGVERGKRNVSIDNIARIAQALRVPIAALFEEERP